MTDRPDNMEERTGNRRGEPEHAVMKALRLENESLKRISAEYLAELEREKVQHHERINRMEEEVAKWSQRLDMACAQIERLNAPSVPIDAFGLAVLAAYLNGRAT